MLYFNETSILSKDDSLISASATVGGFGKGDRAMRTVQIPHHP
jgi:hypothetical protein